MWLIYVSLAGIGVRNYSKVAERHLTNQPRAMTLVPVEGILGRRVSVALGRLNSLKLHCLHFCSPT